MADMDTEQAQWVSASTEDLPAVLRCGAAGLALEIATAKYGKFTVHDNMVTENLIQALSSTNMELLEYISYARSLARRVKRSEGEISSSMLPTRFMAGFEGDARFQHAYLETAKEIAAKRRVGSTITPICTDPESMTQRTLRKRTPSCGIKLDSGADFTFLTDREVQAFGADFDDDICPPAKAEIKDFHSRGQIPKAQIKIPWPLNARKLVYYNLFIIWT